MTRSQILLLIVFPCVHLLMLCGVLLQAEVTGGGVRLSEVDCGSMESRLLPGVFLCGEILDVFGRIGGFNFYWAWVSGRLAGIHVARGGR